MLVRGRIAEWLPLQFRVLYRQFLLRVVDLEALSMQADVPRLLGQFAGVLILISAFQTIGLLFMVGLLGQRAGDAPSAMALYFLQKALSLISGTMLVVGLVTVVSWDTIFPDRRDAMVLAPLPVAPRTILAAKLAASGALLGIAVVALNIGLGTVLPIVAGGSLLGIVRAMLAWWLTMAAATVFLYGAVLAVQGWTTLMLPRRMFLRLSAALQLALFALLLTAWIFQPNVPNLVGRAEVGALAGHWPACWFSLSHAATRWPAATGTCMDGAPGVDRAGAEHRGGGHFPAPLLLPHDEEDGGGAGSAAGRARAAVGAMG